MGDGGDAWTDLREIIEGIATRELMSKLPARAISDRTVKWLFEHPELMAALLLEREAVIQRQIERYGRGGRE